MIKVSEGPLPTPLEYAALGKEELTARIAERLVADGKSENPVNDMKTACWATAMRNKCISKLGIDDSGAPEDPWQALDRARQAASARHDSQAASGPDRSPAGSVGDGQADSDGGPDR